MRRSSADIASSLRREIVSGHLGNSDKLPSERALANRHLASRGTIRKALTTLSSEGLLDAQRGSGWFVKQSPLQFQHPSFEAARPLELMDARFAFEPHICRLAVLNARQEDLESLENLLNAMYQSEGDPVRFSELDTDFHTRLVECTGNSLLLWIVQQFNAVRNQQEWTRMRKLTLEPNIIRLYNEQHEAVVNAIRRREPEDAANLMKSHLETARLSLTRAAET